MQALAPDFHVYSPSYSPINEGTPFSPLLPYSLPYYEKVEVCREFMRGRCHRTIHECRFYHPGLFSSCVNIRCCLFLPFSEHHTIVDQQNMVVICPYIATSGSCGSSRCPFGHPLSHHKLQRVMLTPFPPPYTMGNNCMVRHYLYCSDIIIPLMNMMQCNSIPVFVLQQALGKYFSNHVVIYRSSFFLGILFLN